MLRILRHLRHLAVVTIESIAISVEGGRMIHLWRSGTLREVLVHSRSILCHRARRSRVTMFKRSEGSIGSIGLDFFHEFLDVNLLLFDYPHTKQLCGQFTRVVLVSIWQWLYLVNYIMKGGERQTFSIKCECIILRNNSPINTKKKSKFSVIELDPNRNTLLVMPFGVKKEEEKPFQFSLAKLRAIHKKYIEEGKITLQFFEKTERLTLKGTDVSANDSVVDIFSSILISSASKQNLELLISKIIDLKKSLQPKDSKKKVVPPEPTQKPSQKRRIPQEIPNPLEPLEKLNRKDLRQMANHPVKVQREKVTAKKPMIDFFDIPLSLRAIILEYCRISLEMRLVNKKFSSFVLESIHSIRLKDEIDEASFNKLAMWAVNVECRMRNVKNITLRDKNQEQQLLPNRAKTLRFGQWKEITAKNIVQLKGLRTYCIQLPSSIKFDLSNLFGQRLVELRLKGAPFSRNQFVKVEDLAYILRSIKELKALQLPFCASSLFPLIDHPDRLQQLSIYSISDNLPNSSWTDLTRFTNLLVFNCWYLQKGGVRKEMHEIDFLFAQRLQSLQIGSFLSAASLSKLPFSLCSLKLLGNFFNRHLENIVLPFLKQLDISQAKNIRGEVLEYLQNITLITSWDRNTVDYMKKYAADRNIVLQTTASI